MSLRNTCPRGWSTPCRSMDNIRIVPAARGPPIHTVVHRQALQSTLQTHDFIGCRVVPEVGRVIHGGSHVAMDGAVCGDRWGHMCHHPPQEVTRWVPLLVHMRYQCTSISPPHTVVSVTPGSDTLVVEEHVSPHHPSRHVILGGQGDRPGVPHQNR